jgi:RNA polymerase sigma-70 factor (ECF subfamily)
MSDRQSPEDESPSEGEVSLVDFLAAGRRDWPALEITDADFSAYVRQRCGPTGLPPLLHAGDLFLACGCARGLDLATQSFQALYRLTIRRVCARYRADEALADDVQQAVYERLLVSRGGQPARIGEYKASGSLEAWVARVAITTLLMVQRAARRREQHQSSAGRELGPPLDPELEFIRARYKIQLEQAITRALEELGDRERTLLRLHFGERLNIDAIGAMYGVNRATAARWLVAARQSLLERARAAICASLGARPDELESLGVLLQSQLHVSLARHLG